MGVGVDAPVVVPLGVMDMEKEGVVEELLLSDGEAPGDRDALKDIGLAVVLPVEVGVNVGLGVPLSVGVTLPVPVRVLEGVGVTEARIVGVLEGDTP